MAGIEGDNMAELANLKEKYGPSCRVVSNSGDVKHTVTITPQRGTNITLKFQLTDSYPQEPPQVIVLSSNHDNEVVLELTDFLSSKCHENLMGKPMLEELLATAEEWLRKRKVYRSKDESLDVKPKSAVGNNTKGKKGRRKDRTRMIEEDETRDRKKLSMKTAIDVISRILWDADLPQEYFKIGYIDRFRGIVEKSFEAFSWEDIASVDYETLAIPKHRIQYFKYKNEIVWDKTKRLDNVFGSTGGGLTVSDVIAQYEDRHANDACLATAKTNDWNDDSDDDDDVIVTINNEVDDIVESGDEEDDYWRNKMRPNYFIAVRVTDPDVVSVVSSIQDAILEQEPRYIDSVIPLGALHVTLCTLRLDTPEQISDAARCLQNAKTELKSILSKNRQLDFKELGHFFNRVLYSKVIYDSSFLRFVDHIKMCLQEAGIEMRDCHEFVPHMTLMKVSRPVSRLMGSSTITDSLYRGLDKIEFGNQTVDTIHLCSMKGNRQDDGFYHCATSVLL